MIFLAIRYLLARRKQTILTMLGVFFGTAAFISISGFMLGFREYFVNQLINTSAHIHIQAREEFLSEHSLDKAFYASHYQHVFWDIPPSGRKNAAIVESPQSWYQRLKSDPRVVAFSPQLTADVIFTSGKSSVSTSLIGCDPLQQQKVTTIKNYITEGKFADLALASNRIVIGEDLQKRLGVRLSQNILIASAKGETMPFKVVAIFKTGNMLTDSLAYSAISDVQRMNHTPNQVSEIAVKLRDYSQSAKVATNWSKISPEKVQSWDQINSDIFKVFVMQDTIRFMIIAAILVVAGFGIYNVLNMTTIQKRKDIAILKSMGYTTSDIIFLFFFQGLILGVAGATLGLIFGYLFCLYLSTIPFSGGKMTVGAEHLMISFRSQIYLQAGVLAVIASCVASILPARAAGKLNPIEIIRSGTE